MTLEAKIECCKSEIRYRADYMCLDYDEADIEALTLPDGHTVVALTKMYGPVLHDTDDEMVAEVVRAKFPNMYAVYPTYQQLMERYAEWVGKAKLYAHIPRVQVRFPQLVYMILPDGSIKKSDSLEMIEAMVKKETQRKMVENADSLTKQVKKYLAEQKE